MAARPGNEDESSQILQETLQQVSSSAAGANSRCCVICLGDLVEQCEARPCQHNDFDYLCLVTWLETRATCPLCKSDVFEVRYDLGEGGKYEKVYKVPEQCNGRAKEGLSGTALLPGYRNSSPGRPARPRPYEDEAIRRRRLIYRRKLYSLHVGSNNRQPVEWRYKELSPQLFATNPELVSRARMWLHREPRVFQFLYSEDNDDPPHYHIAVRRRRLYKAEFLLEYIIAILKSIDTQGSAGQAEEMIQEFLGRDNTRLFLHELRAWLRSPYKSLNEWDRVVQYQDADVMRQISQERREEIREDDAHPEQPVIITIL